MEESLGNSPTRMHLNLSREHFLQPPGIGMWHEGISSSPGQPRAAKAAKPIPLLQTYMGGNSSFCHWTIQKRGGKEKGKKKTKIHHPLLSTILEREKEFISCSPIQHSNGKGTDQAVSSLH